MVWSWTLVQNQPLPRSWYQLFQVSQHPSKKDTKRDVCFWDSSATCICGVCHFCTKQSCNWLFSKNTSIPVKTVKLALKLLHWIEAVHFVRVILHIYTEILIRHLSAICLVKQDCLPPVSNHYLSLKLTCWTTQTNKQSFQSFTRPQCLFSSGKSVYE